MPGLAASTEIFEKILLPEAIFEMYFLEWEIPIENEPLKEYAKRISKKITHPYPVLIGVSFGGILIQEIAEFIDTRKIIIISSVKSNLEFPRRMKLAKSTKAYKLIPTTLLSNLGSLIKFSFGVRLKKRLQLYEKFLSVRNKDYLYWAIQQVILWERTVSDKNVIHIHGDADTVFPIKNIQNCIIIKGGTHILILTKYKWLNENLPQIITNES